jgi:hypothetical protein
MRSSRVVISDDRRSIAWTAPLRVRSWNIHLSVNGGLEDCQRFHHRIETLTYVIVTHAPFLRLLVRTANARRALMYMR